MNRATQNSTPVHSDLYSYNVLRTIGNNIQSYYNTIKLKQNCEYGCILYCWAHLDLQIVSTICFVQISFPQGGSLEDKRKP